jgi:hypothetical protein
MYPGRGLHRLRKERTGTGLRTGVDRNGTALPAQAELVGG